ncbi:MAG: glycosyltransferase [Treponema sp.]|nr:glycosyltransferase [Treponema sp.]
MKVAIVHYWLVKMRGGEKVIEALLDLFPDADIYTHVYNPKEISSLINSKKIFTSRINSLPFSKKLYQSYMPLMPKALIDFDLRHYDLIISSESGPAKGIVPGPNAFHLCYCHTPMRYIWDMYHLYYQNTGFIKRFFMKRMTPSLRLWDISSSNLVDCFISNSNYVAARIRRLYNREAKVIHAPVSIERFLKLERKPLDYYLFFGELTGYKRADIAIEACIQSGRKLIVAGAGSKKEYLRKYQKNNLIIFRGRVSDSEANELLSGARALLFPGIEDMGLVPIEANACGCPVIAFREGGALETIKENITGLFFNEQSPASLLEALDHFEQLEAKGVFSDRTLFNENVSRFSLEVFKEKIMETVKERKRI